MFLNFASKRSNIVRIYPIETSFTADASFALAIQPDTSFGLALYAPAHDAQLTFVCNLKATHGSNARAIDIDGAQVFKSDKALQRKRFDEDWQWPTLKLKAELGSVPSGAYVVVAYRVRDDGSPVDDLGRRCRGGLQLTATPTVSDNMALIVARPVKPTSPIAYIVSVATYHAYNSTGGGCFYNDPVHRCPPANVVNFQRPGGGMGAQLGEPLDAYDEATPRQQFMHWDAKFISWLHDEGIQADFYTDVDLHNGRTLDASQYRCILSVGHHEYWSEDMRRHVADFIHHGGNFAVFSGNTCYRPVTFEFDPQSQAVLRMTKMANDWDQFKGSSSDARVSGNESHLIGLGYAYGAGHYAKWVRWRGGWIKRNREAVGYWVAESGNWVFAGTGLQNGESFGANDRIVGYEADGLPPQSDQGRWKTLAQSSPLPKWEMGGAGAITLFRPVDENGSASTGIVFNCGTTDWARVLVDKDAQACRVVQQITRNVIRRLAYNIAPLSGFEA